MSTACPNPAAGWSIPLVEDLLFRQFIKGEDVTSWIPPAVECNPDAYMQSYENTSRMIHQYLRNGAQSAPLSSASVNNIASVSSQSTTKGLLHNGGSNAMMPPTTPLKSQQPMPSIQSSPQQLVAKAAASVYTAVKSSAESMLQKVGVQAKTPPPKVVMPPQPTQTVQFPPPPPLSTVGPSSFNAMQPPASPPSASVVARRERPGVDPQLCSPKSALAKRSRIEWPASVPSNAVLKSKSRSAVAHLTTERVRAQQNFDPDLIFSQPKGELPLQAIFVEHPNALKAITAIRGLSGDWNEDTFTLDEEQQYKKEAGFEHIGPSQSSFGHQPTASKNVSDPAARTIFGLPLM